MANAPLVLAILDGWGISSSCDGNAACQAQTPVLDRLRQNCPNSRLGASGGDVGLPEGQMGNSEVGHLNIGAGRIIYQDLSRISLAIEDKTFFANPTLNQVCSQIAATGGTLHLLGLLSDGGVHSHITHLYALVSLAKQCGVKDVCIHAFLDGRDTPPQSAIDYLQQLETKLTEIGLGRVATITGRYWAMDRDNRWERVEKAYLALTEGIGSCHETSAAAISAAYTVGQTDEFIEPQVIGNTGTIVDNDAVIFFNFRADRAREITRALALDDFSGFERNHKIKLANYVCLTEYDETFGLPIAYPSEAYPNILADVIAGAGLKQLRIAETEKYAHVTFFFNGSVEKAWPGEERILIPSPQHISTYDQDPAMSAVAVTDELIKQIESGEYQLIIVNYANCDMVGHTGKLNAAITAVEAVDTCMGRLVAAVTNSGGKLLVTADHGNCEQMVDGNGEPHTAHTTNPVPFIYVDSTNPNQTVHNGILADLAPTIIDLLQLKIPAAMTGKSLLD